MSGGGRTGLDSLNALKEAKSVFGKTFQDSNTKVTLNSTGSSLDPERQVSLDEFDTDQFGLGTTEGGVDPGLSNAYWGMGTFLFWFSVLMVTLLATFIIIPLTDGGGPIGWGSLSGGWSGQGKSRLNNRNVAVSSLWTGSLKLADPTFVYPTTNSTSSNPAIWGKKVFFTTYDGDVIALNANGHNMDLIWKINICSDVYGLSPAQCALGVLQQKYYSVATPTIWNDYLIVTIRKPAAFAVLFQSSGLPVPSALLDGSLNPTTLDFYPLTECTMSGTVWGDTFFVGTSISYSDQQLDILAGCQFHASMIAFDIPTLAIIWEKDMQNPSGIFPPGNEYANFAGMAIRGSSPPVSAKHNAIYFTTGMPYCATPAFWTCLDVTPWSDWEAVCLNDPRWNGTAFSSIVALDITTGQYLWAEKLYGYRIWQLACDPVDHVGPGGDLCASFAPGDCPFRLNRFVDCLDPSWNFLFQSYDFNIDPVLTIHSSGFENLYVAQRQGVIYSLKADRTPNNLLEPSPAPSRFLWATTVIGVGPGIGGLATDITNVYFTIFNEGPSFWRFSEDEPALIPGCGGWGALTTGEGFPGWDRWVPNPLCERHYGCDVSPDPFWHGFLANIYAPPTVTNDILLITSGDIPQYNWTCLPDTCDCVGVCDCLTTDPNQWGGGTFLAYTKTGVSVSYYNTGAGFWRQGFALHDNCAFTGNGYLSTTPGGDLPYTGGAFTGQVGHKFMGWCVNSPTPPQCS